jgi:hypothetical protein
MMLVPPASGYRLGHTEHTEGARKQGGKSAATGAGCGEGLGQRIEALGVHERPTS